MNARLPPIPSNFLPKEARDILIQASQEPNASERRVAIDAAIDKVKLLYPQYFRHNPLESE